MKIGDWIHSDMGVGKIVKIDENGIPWIESGKTGYGFPCYKARLATEKEIDYAYKGKYFTDPDVNR